MTHINPLEVFGDSLLDVQNPLRYLGGEYGQTVKNDDIPFTFIMAFPDLYEIGMSNQAVHILYNGLNKSSRIRCERVFTPDTDFEQLLKEKNVGLFSLETGIPIKEADCIGFSIGYELGLTGVFTILESGQIPALKKERDDSHPILIAGGCGVTNPAPFTDFLDAVFIGEAEDEFYKLFEELAQKKQEGYSKKELLRLLSENKHVWVPGKKAEKAFDKQFGQYLPEKNFYPVPTIKPVQNHGVIEIMRGCPNGCRFCHAGIYYRPQRVKNPKFILQEAEALVKEGGFREISLTSLSSGDFPYIDRLLDILTKKFSSANVSFQLPSLKVNSFTLPLLEKISEVRKSGLTFAVETPSEAWQLSVNKEVYTTKLVEIIEEAKKRGWNKAKFYFMIGLPPANDERHKSKQNNPKTEEQEIVDFLLEIQERTHIQCSVNVGTFIPKPHTPYERVRQLTMEESRQKMDFIHKSLPRGRFKVSTHDEFVSFVEGIISRGDKRSGHLFYSAFKKGCRLDAWEDHMRKDLWEEAIKESDWNVEQEVTRERGDEEILPWNDISLGAGPVFFKREFQKSVNQEMTSPCSEHCKAPCGVCNVQKNIHVNTGKTEEEFDTLPEELKNSCITTIPIRENNIPLLYRVIFSFRKSNEAQFVPHLAMQEMLHKTFLRAELPVIFTDGFNPVPRMELATCLSLGIESLDEIGSCLLRTEVSQYDFQERMNKFLPKNFEINKCIIYPVTRKKKRVSLATQLYGSRYIYNFTDKYKKKADDFFKSDNFKGLKDKYGIQESRQDEGIYSVEASFQGDRPLRDAIADFFGNKIHKVIHIKKIKTLAKNEHGEALDYFDRFSYLASLHNVYLAKAYKELEIFDAES
ncbi:MAG: TIGR03936 family radical SAM-associated protein [Treponemataceae bacterium]|nr:TIGR03936 family radical SAM-associated protein [Treponemataceae bacterium]